MALLLPVDVKQYLRVDSTEEDDLIGILLKTAEQLCIDILRLDAEQWETIASYSCDEEIEDTDLYTAEEIMALRSILRGAILYAVGYLYEHREEADHNALTLTLRAILSGAREVLF